MRAQTKVDVMERRLETARSRTGEVISRIENQVIDDAIARGTALSWRVGAPALDGAKLLDNILEAPASKQARPSAPLYVTFGGQEYGIHDNAFSQFCTKTELPITYARGLNTSGWGEQLLQHTLNELAHERIEDSRLLFRSVGGQVRGILSDTYRRIDSKPLINALIGEFQKLGVLPCDAMMSDTLISLKAIQPQIIYPVSPDEPYVVGCEFRTSDFGRGEQRLSSYVERVACANGAMGKVLSRVRHVGRRLDEDIEFSDETYRLDTLANISQLKDIVQHGFSAKEIERQCRVLKFASEQKISYKEAENILKSRKDLTKSEQEKSLEFFQSADVVNLPKGDTTYRLSNAVSWLANQDKVVSEERKLELQVIAGELLALKA